MNIIKKYIVDELIRIIDRCELFYKNSESNLSESEIKAILRVGYYDIGGELEDLLNSISHISFNCPITDCLRSKQNNVKKWKDEK